MAIYYSTYTKNTINSTINNGKVIDGSSGVQVSTDVEFDYNSFLLYCNLREVEILQIDVFSKTYEQTLIGIGILRNSDVNGSGEKANSTPVSNVNYYQNYCEIPIEEYNVNNTNVLKYKIKSNEKIVVDVRFREFIKINSIDEQIIEENFSDLVKNGNEVIDTEIKSQEVKTQEIKSEAKVKKEKRIYKNGLLSFFGFKRSKFIKNE